jgi:hypothetical protein
LNAIKVALQKLNFIFVSCDEVTILDNQSWSYVHFYVIDKWKRIPILFKSTKGCR